MGKDVEKAKGLKDTAEAAKKEAEGKVARAEQDYKDAVARANPPAAEVKLPSPITFQTLLTAVAIERRYILLRLLRGNLPKGLKSQCALAARRPQNGQRGKQ